MKILNKHIEGLINSFIKPEKRDRYKNIFLKKDGMSQIIAGLYHMSDFNENYIIQISPQNHNYKDIYDLLIKNGATDNCYILSDNKDINEKEDKLLDVLEKIVGTGYIGIVSCIPGVLIYYEGEDERYYLKK